MTRRLCALCLAAACPFALRPAPRAGGPRHRPHPHRAGA